MLKLLAILALLCFSVPPAWAEDAAEGMEEKVEKCAEQWKMFMTSISDEEARAVCQCIEDEKKRSPIDASKGSKLTGPSGLDNAGPWPNILNYCLYGNERPETGEPAPKD